MRASARANGDIICVDKDAGTNACGNSSDDTQEPSSNGERSSEDNLLEYSDLKYSKDGTSSDDAHDPERGEDPARAVAGASQRQLHPSLDRDGPRHSKGSSQHDSGECKPCAFYCFSHGGCKTGDSCQYCHMFHRSKSFLKSKGRRIPAPSLQRDECGSVPEAQQYHRDEVGASSGESGRSRGNTERNVSFQERERPEEAAVQESSTLGAVQTKDNAFFDSRQDAAASNMFSYLPDNTTATIGQRLELLPLLDGLKPRVFAVAPELPQGLTIDRFTGVIHGVPHESDLPRVYFVTCCEIPDNFKVRTAAVHILFSQPHASALETGMPVACAGFGTVQPACNINGDIQEQFHQSVRSLKAAIERVHTANTALCHSCS